MNPRYPVYVISKGRHDCCLTAKRLSVMKVPYTIVIEPQEFDLYAKNFDPNCLAVLPFSNLGQGSIPARNWVWENSIERGFERHWILDDNIRWFYRTNRNEEIKVTSGTTFRVIEDFADRYTNVGMAGMNYNCFVPKNQGIPPYYFNTRVYSCILIRNDLPFRWRGRFNEDTDLSLRVLKSGECTVLFNAFHCGKVATLTMKGGNNVEGLYKDGSDRLNFAESLFEQHPDCVEIIRRFGRWHHLVNYRKFHQNVLKLKEGVVIPKGVNEYGMKKVPTEYANKLLGINTIDDYDKE